MHIVNRQSLLGLMLGMAVVTSAWAVNAHVAGSSHAMPGSRDFLSISGSPDELAARSERLAAHICEVIKAGTGCRLPAIADLAAADLRNLQDGFSQDQKTLHALLTGPVLDAEAWQVVKDAQLERVQASSGRYLQFLAEMSSALDAEQKQRFAH